MIEAPFSVKHYRSAKARFFKPMIANFFARECPRFFGPTLREKLADELIALFEALTPERTRLRPGQMLWNALDKNTRGDSPRRRYVPVVLTLTSEEAVDELTRGVPMSQISEQAIARLIREAHEQGGILSSRDLALILNRDPRWTSMRRKRYESRHECVLPHTGALHDMGSCVTHKETIVRKAIIQKKDPASVARETKHCQAAVDRYLRDYHRVKTLYKLNHNIEFIHLATEIAKHVIKQYIAIIEEEEKQC
jgi:hypothetical protein